MDSIEEIYSKDIYYPFLLFCQQKNFHTMQDLTRCNFDQLIGYPDLSASVLIRIKGLYATYCKTHPDLLMNKTPKKPSPAPQPAAPVLEESLHAYFKEHGDALIRVADVAKTLSFKRNDVLKTLQQASWCKAVDSGTFFYTGE